MARSIILLLDSFGIGYAHDAEKFGDSGADTLGHICEWMAANRKSADGSSRYLHLPNLARLGLAGAAELSRGQKLAYPLSSDDSKIDAAYTYAEEISHGKDTLSGHWEITGVPVLFDWGYFPQQLKCFPKELVEKIIKQGNLPGVLGEKHASGTEEMKRIGSINDIMSICGYGIPDEEIALFSNERYATYIFENELIPYVRKDGSNTYNQLHFYDLPWPVELLEQMGAEKVKIRITLSYYVRPSPGYAGRRNKYRYPSATLHFDLKSPHENVEEFLCRRNKNEGDKTTDNDTQRWTIKQNRREQGTVQSDWFECTAAELAGCGHIVVYPGPGWWKERKLANVDNVIKYSLIISIETSETEIYNAVETEINNKISIPIMQEV